MSVSEKDPTSDDESKDIAVTSQVYPTSTSRPCVILAIGGNQPSNKGSSAQTVLWAMRALSDRVGSPILKSRLYQTPAFPAGSGPDFVNAAVAFDSALPPADILGLCHAVEADAMRTRDVRWGQRTLDIDFIGYGDHVLPDVPSFTAWRDLPLDRQTEVAPDQLILPHPRMQDRAFVLVPMMDVAPDWHHPVSCLSTRQMLDGRPEAEKAGVRPLDMA